jgi:hypothetical protein
MGVTDIRFIGYGLPDVEAERIFYRDIWGLGDTPPGTTPSVISSHLRASVDEASWKPQVYTPGQSIMDQWGAGVGGPHTMPRAEPDKGLFRHVIWPRLHCRLVR